LTNDSERSSGQAAVGREIENRARATNPVRCFFQPTSMAPRKVSDTEPRRSGRIAALPAAAVAPVEAPKPKAAKAKAAKKRSAEDLDDAKEGETSAAKKVRTGFFLSFFLLVPYRSANCIF